MKLGLRNYIFSLIVVSLVGYQGRSENAAAATPEYRLRFFHTHTNERLDIVYPLSS